MNIEHFSINLVFEEGRTVRYISIFSKSTLEESCENICEFLFFRLCQWQNRPRVLFVKLKLSLLLQSMQFANSREKKIQDSISTVISRGHFIAWIEAKYEQNTNQEFTKIANGIFLTNKELYHKEINLQSNWLSQCKQTFLQKCNSEKTSVVSYLYNILRKRSAI